MSEKKIKKPVGIGKVAKVPVVMQMEALECGAASLAMVLAYYGKWIPLEQVRIDCGVSRDGSNARDVLIAARSYGLTAQGYRFEPERLRREGHFPCIVHWNFNHFVVLDGFRGDKAYLNDPARGSYSVSMEDFDKAFTGICLMFEPGEDFETSGKRANVMDFAKKRMRGMGVAVAFVVLTTVIRSLTDIIRSGFSRVFMDQLLSGQNPVWLTPFTIGMSALALVQIIVAWMNAVYSLRINGKMAAVGNSEYMWKVLRLPLEFYSQRMAGDIQQRMGTNASIAGTMVNTVAPLFLNTVMMIIYLVIMFRFSVPLTLVGLTSVVVNLIVSRFVSKKRVNLTRVLMRDSGKLSAATVSGIEMIETLKASGAENGYFEKWAGYQASVNTQNVKYARMNEYLGLIPSAVSQLVNAAVLVLGIWLTMSGKFTVGMIFAFQGFLSAFTGPASSLIDAGQTFTEMRSNMERVEDVMKYPTRKNLFILGDPGQAKSYAINAFRSRIDGAVQFERLLSKQTDEEQIFGRIDLSSLIPGSVPEKLLEKDSKYQEMRKALEAAMDDQRNFPEYDSPNKTMVELTAKMEAYRKAMAALHPSEPMVNTSGKLPEADICFLDEIFKCNDGVLNSLLTALNERKYTNEGRTYDIPTISFFAASNEIPNFNDPQEKILAALYDRLELKVVTANIADRDKRLAVLRDKQTGRFGTVGASIMLNELRDMQKEVAAIPVPDAINELVDDILCELRKEVPVSDRKYLNYYPIAQAKAWLSGHAEVESTDLLALKNYLWYKPADIPMVESTLTRMCVNPMQDKVNDVRAAAKEVIDELNGSTEAGADARKAFRKFRSEMLRVYRLYTDLAGKAQGDGEKAMLDGLLSDLESGSRAAHEKYGFTYMPLQELAELQ